MGVISKLKNFLNPYQVEGDAQCESAPSEHTEDVPPFKLGVFDEDKFFEDQKVKDGIKEKMGDVGYFDSYLVSTILNVRKVGVENLLAQCEEAVEHFRNGGGEIDKCDKRHSVKQKEDFFVECVALCKIQLKKIEEGKYV